MSVLVDGILLVSIFRLNPEGVGAKVITLCLQQVGGEVLGAVTVVETERGAESWGGNSPNSTLGHNISPAALSVVDSLVEEVIEQKVLEVGVAAVCIGDILEENGTDDATTAPHEGNLGLVELPLVFLGGLRFCVREKLILHR